MFGSPVAYLNFRLPASGFQDERVSSQPNLATESWSLEAGS
jgi:hypothetical protein